LNGTVLLLPLYTQRQGKEKFCSPVFSRFPSLSQRPKTDTTHTYLLAKDEKAEETSSVAALE
jgi:hypothetical protein